MECGVIFEEWVAGAVRFGKFNAVQALISRYGVHWSRIGFQILLYEDKSEPTLCHEVIPTVGRTLHDPH
jgi:hypothetical protein